jgi:hypothetical protein
MIKIQGKTLIYKIQANELGEVNQYLFVDRLAEEINKVFPFLEVNKLLPSKKQSSMEIYCLFPTHYTKEQINLIKIQIELLSSNLLAELKDKIHFAGLAS